MSDAYRPEWSGDFRRKCPVCGKQIRYSEGRRVQPDCGHATDAVVVQIDMRPRDTEVLEAVRALHQRVGRPKVQECSCGLIVCDTLRVLEGRQPGGSQ